MRGPILSDRIRRSQSSRCSSVSLTPSANARPPVPGASIAHGAGGDNRGFQGDCGADFAPILPSWPESSRAMLARCMSHSSSVSSRNSSGDVRRAQEKERGGGQRAGDQGGERGIAREIGDREPDRAEDQRRRPGEAEQHADIGGDALAALEAEPDRKEMAEKGAQPRGERREAAEPERGPGASRRKPSPAPPRCLSACRRQASRRRASCCRCAAHWWRRYCRSRWCARPARRSAASGSARTGSSRADSRTGRRGRWSSRYSVIPRHARKAREPGNPEPSDQRQSDQTYS